jgi:hypothetical protein
MSVSPTFRTFVLEQLGRVLPDLRARSMFGGVGLCSGERFFAMQYYEVPAPSGPWRWPRGKRGTVRAQGAEIDETGLGPHT